MSRSLGWNICRKIKLKKRERESKKCRHIWGGGCHCRGSRYSKALIAIVFGLKLEGVGGGDEGKWSMFLVSGCRSRSWGDRLATQRWRLIASLGRSSVRWLKELRLNGGSFRDKLRRVRRATSRICKNPGRSRYMCGKDKSVIYKTELLQGFVRRPPLDHELKPSCISCTIGARTLSLSADAGLWNRKITEFLERWVSLLVELISTLFEWVSAGLPDIGLADKFRMWKAVSRPSI